jgi:hypothetical protein
LVAERTSRFEGDESASYAALDDATADILSSIQKHFGLVPKRWILWHVRALWLRRSIDAIGEEQDGRMWIEYCVFFISKFFYM